MQTDRLLDLLAPINERAQATARRLCRSDADGDDLFQDATIRALDQLGKLRDPGAFPFWFYRILLSCHRTQYRRSLWRRMIPLQDVAPRAEQLTGEDGAGWEDARQGASRMRAALAILSEVQREAFVLFEIEGYSLNEVADMQQVSVSAVKSRLVRARAHLRRHYQKIGCAPSHLVAPALAEKGNTP